MVLARAASLGRRCAIIDVENCFQNDAIPHERRLFITAPPRYVKWFKNFFPEATVENAPDGKYVLQTLNGMQGRKDASRNWYLLLKSILEEFGFSMCKAEPALFVYVESSEPGSEETLEVSVSTDNFFCTYDL